MNQGYGNFHQSEGKTPERKLRRGHLRAGGPGTEGFPGGRAAHGRGLAHDAGQPRRGLPGGPSAGRGITS